MLTNATNRNHSLMPSSALLRVVTWGRRWYTKLMNDGLWYTLCAALAIVNACLFMHGVWWQVQHEGTFLYRLFIPGARGCGIMLEFNCAIILIPMCHAVMTRLRRYTFFKLLIPFGYLRRLHIIIARTVVGAALGHGILHIAGSIGTWAQGDPHWDAGVHGGICLTITGALLSIVLFLIAFTAIERVRRVTHFETFYYTHHLFLVFYALLLLHGQHGGKFEFWKWYLLPGLLYTLDRIYRLVSGSLLRQCNPISLTYNAKSKVVRLEVPKMFEYSAGQYADIKIPAISTHQVHPFTIASAPEDETMVFYIKKFGGWTRHLAKIAETPEFHPLESLEVYVMGPLGAPAQFSFHFDHLLFIGTGIGATPFISAMRHAAYTCDQLEPAQVAQKRESAMLWAKRQSVMVDLSALKNTPDFRLFPHVAPHMDYPDDFDEEDPQSDSGSAVHALEHALPGTTGDVPDELDGEPSSIPEGRRARRIALWLYRQGSLLSFLAEIWIVLICILLEVINLIFLDGENKGLTFTTFALLIVVLVSLALYTVLDFLLHGPRFYCQSWRNFISLLESPVTMALVLFCILAQGLKSQAPPLVLDSLGLAAMGVLFVVLFIRLTLRVGARSLLQLPHQSQVECVRSIDFVWVNSSNDDAKWMSEELEHLESHASFCKSGCAKGMEFRHHLYITREEPELFADSQSISATRGRPNMNKIFDELVDHVLNHPMKGGDTVGVFFCGSPAVGQVVQRECITHTIKHRYRDHPMYFIYHQEIF